MQRISNLHRESKPKQAPNTVEIVTKEIRNVVITKKTKTIKQTAWIIGTSPENIRTLIDMGKLRALKFGDTRIPDAEIDRFLTWALDSDTDLKTLIAQYQQDQKEAENQ